ncbi:MAG TPA: hypothetical protein ENI23_01900 [bacterium]|nr:hypothetical protein [bacterium]
MTLPKFYRNVGETGIKSYNYVDIANGLGYTTFYLTNTQDPAFTEYVLGATQLIASTNDGLLGTNQTYEFETSTFNLPRRVNGTAYLTGFAKTNTITATAKMSVRSGSITSSTEGSSIATHAAEIEQGVSSYVLVKTFSNVNEYVNKLTCEMKSDNPPSTTFLKVIYNYELGGTYESIQSFTGSLTYIAKTASNANKNRSVKEILVYIYGSTNNVWIQLQDVISQNVVGITTTDISSAISMGTIPANSGFLISIPLTRTLIKKDQKLLLTIKKTSGSGSFILDPTNEFATEESLKLNVPFILDI